MELPPDQDPLVQSKSGINTDEDRLRRKVSDTGIASWGLRARGCVSHACGNIADRRQQTALLSLARTAELHVSW
jgi:hypothetical protein